jgi:hypothetical protein
VATEISFTRFELEALADALAKAASRHQSYAKFKPASKAVRLHEQLAVTQQKLRSRVVTALTYAPNG